MGLFSRKSTAQPQKNGKTCGKLLTFAGRAGLVPLAPPSAVRPRWRGMLTPTARARATAPLPLAVVGSVGRRLRLFAVLKLSAPRPVLRPARPAKAGFSPAGGCASVGGPPLDTNRSSCNIFADKWRYSVIFAAGLG